MTGPVEPPVNYPGLLHFRCGHGIAISGDTVGPSVWMVVTDSARVQQGVSMQPADAITIASALVDSAVRADEVDTNMKVVGGLVEATLRAALEQCAAGNPQGAMSRLRWLLGEEA